MFKITAHKKKIASRRSKISLAVFTVLFAGFGTYYIVSSFAATPQTCSSITQYGITWTFDKTYPCGNFANGDWWVIPNSGDSAVRILSITPNAASGRNGWEVNPTGGGNSTAYDDRVSYDYQASLQPALPYNAAPNSSIIKAISRTDTCLDYSHDNGPCLRTAAVLTVLGSVPPNEGSNIFRPTYYGTQKPLYTTDQIQTNLLPNLTPPSTGRVPTLDQIKNRFQRVQLNHKNGDTYRDIIPIENFFNIYDPSVESEYGAEISNDNADAALRLMLNDPIANKMPALINYIQAGIDWYGVTKGGVDWYASGGLHQGRKLPIVFAAVMLNDPAMKSFIQSAPRNTFSEDGQIYMSSVAGKALFGMDCNQGDYELNQSTGRGSRECRDPKGYIDGGQIPGDWYMLCCTTMSYKATSLTVRLMPELRSLWDYEPLHNYIDRWVDFGTWTLPDPDNRYPLNHGINRDSGGYASEFADAMWTAHRSLIGDTYTGTPPPTCAKQADINCDNAVNVTDLSILLSNYGKTTAQLSSSTPSYPRADVNTSGKVDIADLSALLTGYGK